VQSSAEQCRAVQSSAEQCRAVQSSAEQCSAEQSRAVCVFPSISCLQLRARSCIKWNGEPAIVTGRDLRSGHAICAQLRLLHRLHAQVVQDCWVGVDCKVNAQATPIVGLKSIPNVEEEERRTGKSANSLFSAAGAAAQACRAAACTSCRAMLVV
jgi:hypothetical protein